MKAMLPLCVVLALTTFAQRRASPRKRSRVQEKHVPDLNKSPWSVDSSTKSDGAGTPRTTIKREIGDGLSIGGQMKPPYQEPVVGGQGPPGPLEGARGGSTILGPVLEKKF